ncbi:carbamoyl-phosphate synthase small subunit [Isoptericola sp. CG 20/1183]|uniref:Carbamoyl phosphate synthase small chain n=1 Tax=Isoptericola halotolerans TaxID=300560 RepID=A0ABX5EB43_9MICO|nr:MULTISPECIES: glutamine-hydrolyzing carbamoyl-phosphate synthase small subunit [Isoptericola]MCK0115497.1 glutamine-hydrolyzing carbamoyl-phosphate synthase small subunit [Isoptericola sp. S6320L]PRZ04427.1 carbamoyl-phosphate synthase small subunit [Isoptericola halotolerans]PRZ04675.1 carbamoyl-phosphate synthase small subunit [Isoptericola sp. CG 20/1183]
MTSSTSTDPAVLVLEDGTVARGTAYGARGTTVGEIVFSTGMTGYQETLTDPSYHRQIVVMTAPHVGNTGVNDDDPESHRIWVAGYVLRDPARRTSSWRSRGDLADELAEQGVVGIAEVDTRFLTRHLRELGVMRAGIFSGDDLVRDGVERDVAELVAEVRAAPPMAGADLAREVTTAEAYTVEPRGLAEGSDPVATVVAVDLGIKTMTPVRLAERGVRVHVVPQSTTVDEVAALLPTDAPAGVFFSNGPGDPSAATAEIDLLRGVLDRRIPFFGICFGNQLLGRALGYGTYKLAYGHRGINQPVMDRTTGKVEVTAQNHGFAVDAPLDSVSTAPYDDERADDVRYGRVIVSHVGLNDQVVEGLTALDLPAFSVQYHPEAAAGPHDSAYLFDRFVDLMTTREPVTVPASALALLADGSGEKEN